MVDEVGGGIGHSAPSTGRAEAAALAREGNEAVAATGVAVPRCGLAFNAHTRTWSQNAA